jgi:hypothetical protein
MQKVSYNHMALYIKYTGGDLSIDNVMEYLYKDGDRGLLGMTTRGTIDEITIFTPGGVLRITGGEMFVKFRK